MSSPLSTSSSIYRDKKLATWIIQQPKMGQISVPFWQGISEGYCKKTTIQSLSKEDLMNKINTYSKNNERKISDNESKLMVSYGSFSALAGGTFIGVSRVLNSNKLAYSGAFLALSGISLAIFGKIMAPSEEEKSQGEEISILI